MSILNFDHHPIKTPRKITGLTSIFGVAVLVSVVAIGSTLASNISLNSGDKVEFGQGVALTTACDNEITLTPTSTFANSEGAGNFLFTSFSVSGVASECEGKIFTIRAFESGESNPLSLYETTGIGIFNQIQILYLGGNFHLFRAGLQSDDISNFTDGFIVTLATAGPPQSTALASALDVDRITIESRDATCTKNCQLGDVGPGGGMIFYVSSSPFTAQYSQCQDNCHYLESAQYDWPSPDPATSWSLDTTNTVVGLSADPGVNDGPGKGSMNTHLMSLQPGGGDATNNAGLLSLNYAASDHSAGQWYLPSHAELQAMISWSYDNGNILNIGDFGFWSSNEVSNIATQSYGSSRTYPLFGMLKFWSGSTRPIRAF